jgi:hypothetical protein
LSLSLILHGHFYQPPRENPFLDEVETEESAAPFHDWNQRIERECYRAVTAARLTGREGRIRRIVNTLEWISFNFGPTLLEWLEREARDTYRAILEADRLSALRLQGHGNAIAQPYHHTILPLATRRDKRTEVRWGKADFRRRFGHEPEGMWLPETAVDDETLDVLAEEGIRFTIVAPHQVRVAPHHGHPGRYRTGGGRTITLCLYHGDLSHGIAFGGLLHDAVGWVTRMMALGREMASRGDAADTAASSLAAAAPGGAPPGPGESAAAPRFASEATLHRLDAHTLSALGGRTEMLLSAATDGETYGHHHKFGEMALAKALDEMQRLGARVENFGAFLDRVPAIADVQLVEPSAWSCAHGVERWRTDCGCRIDGLRNPSQAWRAPLRRGLEELADSLHDVYEREAAGLVAAPWEVRDAYGAVVASDAEALEGFARERGRGLPPDQIIRLRELLEMERDALRMFTSCAWFFDDIGGLEPRQVLRYAARAIALAGPDGTGLEARLLHTLATARSNDATVGTGRDVYLATVKPRVNPALAMAAAAVAAAHVEVPDYVRLTTADVDTSDGRVRLQEPRTGRRHELEGRVVTSSVTDVQVELVDGDGDSHRLAIADFPERSRHAIRSRIRRILLPRSLTPEEIDALLAGDATVEGLVRVALLRNVERLTTGMASPAAEQHVHEMLDLLEQLEVKIPFDAQTAFWRAWTVASPGQRAEWHDLSLRLGFALAEGPD